ncbi:MAG: SGNH/GDSL hydrolase family protein [Burkholderiales bacterium]
MKSSRSNGWGRTALCAGVLVSALLASCGGGSQGTIFTASRVVAFGDESSVIRADGFKYTVNGLAAGSTTTVDCLVNPIWVQTVAASYGLLFPECPGTVADPVSRIYATNGAKVADLGGKIDEFLANGGFAEGDLVTVLVGANDVVEQFAQYPAVGEDQLLANLDAAGAELAAQVNRLAGLGAKVLVSTIPNMGLTPFAGDRTAGSTNGNPAVLTRLSTRFNDAMLSRLLNDGHKIGLIQLDEYLGAVDKAAQLGATTYANTTTAACAVALPNCTTNTLVADAANAVWLWADDRRLGPTGQSNLGALAVNRAQNNPF